MTAVIINRMTASARDRMILSAAVLMRQQGVEATSFSDVIEHSGAPRGSIYHHFPNGKAQLIEAATRYAGEFTAAGLIAALRTDKPADAVDAFAAQWTSMLEQSNFDAGCPVVAAALEGERTPGARAAAGDAFGRWQHLVARALEPHTTRWRARTLATLVIASIEGAVIMARAQRSTVPLEEVANELRRILRGDLPPQPASQPQ